MYRSSNSWDLFSGLIFRDKELVWWAFGSELLETKAK
jgi:hypothetical protein